MAEQKPTVEGLMGLVMQYGNERSTGNEMDNRYAEERAYTAVEKYAKRFAAGVKVCPECGPVTKCHGASEAEPCPLGELEALSSEVEAMPRDQPADGWKLSTPRCPLCGGSGYGHIDMPAGAGSPDEAQRFEQWARRKGINVEKTPTGTYWYVKAHEAWQVWQAAAPKDGK